MDKNVGVICVKCGSRFTGGKNCPFCQDYEVIEVRLSGQPNEIYVKLLIKGVVYPEDGYLCIVKSTIDGRWGVAVRNNEEMLLYERNPMLKEFLERFVGDYTG